MVTGYNNDVVVMNNGEDTRRSRNCGVTGLLWLVGEAPGSGVNSSPSVGSMDAATGVKTYERYKPWGDTAAICRGSTTLPTRYQFTGQRKDSYITDGLASQGLYWMGSRYYDPALGRFLQPDTMIPDPGNPLDWDRYAYTRNNPLH